MTTAYASNNGKRTTAYRNIVTPPPAPTRAGSTPVAQPARLGFWSRLGAWIKGAAAAVVRGARKIAGWFGAGARKVVSATKSAGRGLATAGRAVGRFARKAFVVVATAARKAGRGLRTAFLATVRVGALVIGWVLRALLALLAGVVAIPIAFVVTVKMVMTHDPRFQGHLIAN